MGSRLKMQREGEKFQTPMRDLCTKKDKIVGRKSES